MKNEKSRLIEIEVYGEASAHIWHFGPARTDEILRRLGISSQSWQAANGRYTAELAHEISREETVLTERFVLAAGRVQRRLKVENPAIESIGPLDEHALDEDRTPSRPVPSPDVEPALPLSAVAPEPPPVMASPPTAVPSFLRIAGKLQPPSYASAAALDPPQPAIASPLPRIESPRPAAPLGTLPVFILPSAISLPFARQAPQATAVESAKAHAAAVQGPGRSGTAPIGETVAPSDLAAVMQRVMPFASGAGRQTPGAPAPATPAPASPPRPRVDAPGIRSREAPPAPRAHDASSVSPLAPAMLSLEQYASLHEDLVAAGERGAEVLQRYGLSLEHKRTVDDHWQRQFQLQPSTHAAWERARATYRTWLSQRPR